VSASRSSAFGVQRSAFSAKGTRKVASVSCRLSVGETRSAFLLQSLSLSFARRPQRLCDTVTIRGSSLDRAIRDQGFLLDRGFVTNVGNDISEVFVSRLKDHDQVHADNYRRAVGGNVSAYRRIGVGAGVSLPALPLQSGEAASTRKLQGNSDGGITQGKPGATLFRPLRATDWSYDRRGENSST
jgi:hypothetical protein